jgi:hypothetical protein
MSVWGIQVYKRQQIRMRAGRGVAKTADEEEKEKEGALKKVSQRGGERGYFV